MLEEGIELKEKAYEILRRKGQKFSEKFKNRDLDVLLQELDIFQAQLEAQNDELLEKEKKLNNSKLEYETIFMNAPIAYFLLDEKLNILKVNFKANEYFNTNFLFKHSKKSFLNLIGKGGIESFLRVIDSKTSEEKKLELDMLVRKKKNKFLVNILNYPLDENCLLVTLTDIQKEIELSQIADELNKQKDENYKEVLYSFVDMVEKRDPYTAGHSKRVAIYSKLIAETLNLSKEECELVYEAGMLHDIGKVVIPDSILLKPMSLLDIEFELIKEHVNIGASLLHNIKNFNSISNIIKCHHERENGSGYPNGLRSNEIPFLAKIMAVADSFDAMTTNRAYSKVMNKNEALAEVEQCKEILFDKEVVDAAQKVFSKIELHSHVNQNPITSMDKARFSYFYNDQLTGLHNKEYLEFVIQSKEFEDFKYISFFSLKNFSLYNNKYTWEMGDVFLKDIAKELLFNFSESEIFRLNGDDFIILSKKRVEFSLEDFKNGFDVDLITFLYSNYKIKENSINSLRDLISIRGNL